MTRNHTMPCMPHVDHIHEETQQCLDFLVILTTPMVANRTQQRFE